MKLKKYIIIAIAATSLVGCQSTEKHRASLQTTKEREFTTGLVQKEISVGMNSVAVLEALGSPNMVQKDKTGNETWVYDKIASEAYYSKSSGGMGLGVVLGILSAPLGARVGGSFSKETGAAATTQRTLTVIIKFDENSNVSSCSYHSSKF